MAEKILNTRILMKVDTLENWNESTLPLKKGELAIATVAATAGTGLAEPVCMIKIGEGGTKTFKDLEWNLYAKASDVLAACKSEAALTAFVNGVIADAGIASSSAMEALADRVTTAEGAIDALEGLVGDTKVADQITAAITALDLANTYEAKGEAAKVQTALDTYKTSNDAAVQKNATDISGEIARAKAAEEANAGAITAIKDGTTIDSFADVEAALAGKQATGDYATKAEAQAMADGKDAAIAEAKKAGTDAAAAAAAAQADADALEALVGDTKVSEQISGAIEDLDLANTYAAKVHTHVKADITDFAHTHEIADVNGLQGALDGKQAAGDYATKTEAQGYADAKDTAIAEAKQAGEDAQTSVNQLNNKITPKITTLIGTDVDKSVREIANEELAAQLVADGAKESLDTLKEIADWIQQHPEDAAEINSRLDALEGAVDTETTVSAQIGTAIENALKVDNGEGAKVEKYALATDLAATNGEVAKKANDAELAAVAKSGLIDDLSIGEGTVLVFDCGDSSGV